MEPINKDSNIQQELSPSELADKLNKETELNISQLTYKAVLNSSLVGRVEEQNPTSSKTML
jgi:hypothetical protein